MRYPESAADLARGRGAIPVLRPPGAIEENAFLAGCTRCGDCVTACPHDVLQPAPQRFRAAAGTPTFDPLRNPCLMCDELPCIAACEPGVLSREAGIDMGTARIDPQVCLAYSGTGCSVCVERCPVSGAIEIDDRMRPRIAQDACTGCGICQHVCPAPQNAVGIMPTFARPTP
jgi:ferredoxin-type protein NapG